ncbi:Cell fate regulator YlbF, YheA/YmcA/DUF963 family (controls sporulation, competence, biofilm development) [Ruminococcaceae bacterium FB2012]|nr:Cell fate regulator YlbF, YheA/YmcA/DUF963 family (controls sporulation, competence, biofilm development) [Ruminococcaceae bacterium FB2012]
MSALDTARQLGAAIQQDERYIKFQEASKASDADKELQSKIGDFNIMRMNLSTELHKEESERDAEKMVSLENDIKAVYDEIMAMPNMIAYNEAKAGLDYLINSVQFIISVAANGGDPMSCPDHAPSGCGGSCSTCGGCG